MARTSRGLSQSTCRKVLHSVFHSYDHDSSMTLDKDELATMLSDLGVEDQDQCEGLSLLADSDGDGVVTFEEFVQWIKTHSVMEMLQSGERMEILERISSLFQEYDSDGDGTLTWLEWQKAFVTRGSTVEEAVRVWNLCNTDCDEIITFAEFWTYLKALMPPAPSKPKASTFSSSAGVTPIRRESSVSLSLSGRSRRSSLSSSSCVSPVPSETTLCSSRGATPY